MSDEANQAAASLASGVLTAISDLRYWYKKLDESKDPTTANIRAYLIARHGMTWKQVGAMTPAEITVVLRQDWERLQADTKKSPPKAGR